MQALRRHHSPSELLTRVLEGVTEEAKLSEEVLFSAYKEIASPVTFVAGAYDVVNTPKPQDPPEIRRRLFREELLEHSLGGLCGLGKLDVVAMRQRLQLIAVAKFDSFEVRLAQRASVLLRLRTSLKLDTIQESSNSGEVVEVHGFEEGVVEGPNGGLTLMGL